MRARLVALDGRDDIPIVGLLTVVGRDRGCDAILDSSRVSRRHCCLALGAGDVLVRDLGSTNGIAINGIRAAEGLLRPGDVLTIAHLRFRLAWDNTAEQGHADPDGADQVPRPESGDPEDFPTDGTGLCIPGAPPRP